MSKAQSVGTLHSVDNDTHTLVVEVKHSDYASYSRSVLPCANKVFDKFMRSPEGQAWIRAGYARFQTRADFGALEGGSRVTYTISLS
jgi:hypothetical protein